MHFWSGLLTIEIINIMPKRLKICLIIAFIVLSAYTVSPASAQTMSNNDYIIKMQGFNTISGTTANTDYKVRSPVGNFSPEVFEGVNFKVKTGFESLASSLPFSISLSSNLVDFGTLSPTNPVIRTVDLNTHSQTAYGYSVIVFENEPLTTIPPNSKTFIPDTTCDNGECGTENAAEWINALTYGFGYRCDNVAGADCDSSFAKANSYKHFPDIASNDDPQSIMAGIGSNNKEARISHKVNISGYVRAQTPNVPGTQAQDIYSNIITYIAVPNF